MQKRYLQKLDISIPVCGMVKDDHHRTRGLYYKNVELPIDIHSEAFRLITRIQDEAHRFAIDLPQTTERKRTGTFDSGRHSGSRAGKKKRTDEAF